MISPRSSSTLLGMTVLPLSVLPFSFIVFWDVNRPILDILFVALTGIAARAISGRTKGPRRHQITRTHCCSSVGAVVLELSG